MTPGKAWYRMSNRKTRLNDIFPQAGIMRNGIFGYMYNAVTERPAWLSDLNIALQLDRVFFGKYGRRIISPMLERYLMDNALTPESGAMVASDVFALHSYQWAKKYALLSIDYNPLSNYDMTETESINAETENETSGTISNGGYTERRNSATGTITETVRDSGTVEREKSYSGAETDTVEKSGEETRETAYSGTKTNRLDKIGAERTIESWAGNQTVTTTESGAETESKSVYAFNSVAYEPSGKSDRTFTGRETLVTTTLPDRTSETAQRDRSDTETETYQNRRDTETTSYDNRIDTTTREFNNRTDTETETYDNRQTEKITDDSGHVATERTDNNLSETSTGSASGNSVTERTLQRSGNIGVTTSQQMAQSEIALWQWNFYYDVFADVVSEIAIGAY